MRSTALEMWILRWAWKACWSSDPPETGKRVLQIASQMKRELDRLPSSSWPGKLQFAQTDPALLLRWKECCPSWLGRLKFGRLGIVLTKLSLIGQ